jgi:hypothetical protein
MKRIILAATLAALVTGGLSVATAPGAAADDTTAFDCTGAGVGDVQLRFGFEAEAPAPPATLTLFHSPMYMNMRMESAVPGVLAKAAADAGATSVSVSVVTSFSDAAPAGDATWRTSSLSTQAPVPLGDQAVPSDVMVEGRGQHQLVFAGINDLRPGDLTVTLVFLDGGGEIVGDVTRLTCTTPAAPLADTVWVSSVTFLDLLVGTDRWGEASSSRSYAYGQPIPVRVRVGAFSPQSPGGWVDITLDGVTHRAPLGPDGEAALMVPGPLRRAGGHSLSAVFVPADPTFFGGGASVRPPGGINYTNPVMFPVTKARATAQPRVTGKRVGRTTRVHLWVVPAFDSSPTGKVRVDLRRLGTRQHWSRTRTITVADGRSKVQAGFGRLSRGRYKLVVKYRGDADHLRSRTSETFRVRR